MKASNLCGTCCDRMFGNRAQVPAYFTKTDDRNTCVVCRPAAPTSDSDGTITRKYQCGNCGYRHRDGVSVTVEWPEDNNHEPIRKAGSFTGWFTCDECGMEQIMTTRVTSRDFEEAGI